MPATSPMTAQDLGALKNSLGILVKNKSFVSPERLLNVTGLTPSNFSEISGISRPQFYRKEIPVRPSSKFIKRVLDIVFVTDLVFDLFGGNVTETTSWLMTPNSLLFGDSPFDVCMRGESEPLKRWLLERLGQQTLAG